jgi:hypothetical protein
VLIVRTAEEPDPVGPVNRLSRESVAVIEFQGAGLHTPSALPIGKRAPATVPLEHFASDGVRHMTRRRCSWLFGRSLPRLATRREALLLDLFDQNVERLFENLRDVSVGDAVAE